MRRNSISFISVFAFLAAASWTSNARAGTVWCYTVDTHNTIECDNDFGGVYTHEGPDGERDGYPLLPGHGASIPQDTGSPAAIYRLYNFTTKVHLLTQYYSEAVAANNSYGFSFEQVEARFPNNGPGTLPLYRASNNTNGDFLYTTNGVEAEYSLGYRYNGIAGYVYYSSGAGRCPLYRSYNPSLGMHVYTISNYEYDYAAYNGLTQEGIVGYVLPVSGSCPII